MSSDEGDEELYGTASGDDVTLPKVVINKMIREQISDCRVSNDARELISQCATEFIHLLSSEGT